MSDEWPHYDEYMNEYETYSVKLNNVLYGMCRQLPGHTEDADVWAKVWIIGRAYATQIERHQKHKDRLYSVVERVKNCASWLDPGIRELRAFGMIPTVENATAIAQLHHRFVVELSNEMRGRHRPLSFASKYLHFHAPVVPIYDSIARSQLRAAGWYRWRKNWTRRHPEPAGVDLDYWRYCIQIALMADHWKFDGLDPTARNLDTYLFWWAFKHQDETRPGT